MNWIKKMFQNQAVRYIFFGGCTTLVNLVSYTLMRTVLGIDITIAGFISILLSIAFAYVVNKIFVFESKTNTVWEVIKECAQFVGMRLLTMYIEVFGVLLLSCVWGMNDLIAKLVIQVVVLVLNYVFSKAFVFKEKKDISQLTEKERKNRKTKKWCVIASAGIPAVVMLIAYIANGVFPFGDHGVLIIDSLHQYLPFFTDFHDKLAASESLLYSFGGGLGYNFWATYAYYLASPLNFLIVLFPARNMMDVMAYLIVIKIALCGGCFGYYLTTRNKGKNFTPVVFAVMYALSSFMIGYYFNLMWLDSIALLPIVMLGIERIVKGESGRTFGLSLFLGLYCNYYIGFMLCLFSCLYFLVQWIAAKRFTIKAFFKSGINFAWYALLSGGMAALVLMPAYRALGITESMDDNGFPDKIKFFTSTIDQLTSHFAFVEPINIADDQAGVNAYCGVIILILVVLYVLDKKVSLRERISKILLCALLVLSFNFNMLNFVWHGFHTQNGLPNRFSFIYICLILVMGYEAFTHVKNMHVVKIIISCLVPIGFVVYCMITKAGERDLYVYLVTLGLLVIYSILLLLYRFIRLRALIVQNVVLGVMLAEMITMGIYGVCSNGTVGRSTYLDEQSAYKKLMAEQGDQDFYRSEIDSQRMRNETMFMGGNGVVLFSSTMPAATVNMCKGIGMEARTNKNGYNGMTKLFSDVFGVRYLVSKANSDTLYNMNRVGFEEPLALYKNENALSLGFMVNSAIKDWQIEGLVPMEIQDQFAGLATGSDPIFTLREEYDIEEGPTYIIRLHPGEQTYLEMTSNVEKLVIKTPQYEKTINGYNSNLFDLGRVTEDGKANVTITYKEGNENPVGVRVYTCKDEDYTRMYEKLSANQMNVTTAEDGKIRGNIDVKTAGTLLTSIPYDTGWKVKVDGKEIETYAVGTALMGFDLSEGQHEITMDFTPEGLWSGSFISIASIVLFMVTIMLEGRSRRKKGLLPGNDEEDLDDLDEDEISENEYQSMTGDYEEDEPGDSYEDAGKSEYVERYGATGEYEDEEEYESVGESGYEEDYDPAVEESEYEESYESEEEESEYEEGYESEVVESEYEESYESEEEESEYEESYESEEESEYEEGYESEEEESEYEEGYESEEESEYEEGYESPEEEFQYEESGKSGNNTGNQ
ncbi:YfhO family protein [uncultured Robinsoniella sp.]|uniref:YfhO family protein n=1 Tax=uncultured Robinsoniella sp. TaxID=904190 RepID=UPI00374FC4D5